MIEITDIGKFGKVIAKALADIDINKNLTSGDKIRWVNAIAKASTRIETQGVFMDWQEDDKSLLIWSQGSNEIYTANGKCQCLAFKANQPCWHRAATKLYKNYLALETIDVAPTNEEMDNAPLIRQRLKSEEKIGGMKI